MNKKILLLAAFFFTFFFLSQEASAQTWWNSTWQARRNITINNTRNSNNLTDYQVAINITFNTYCNATHSLDFSCIRFTWYNSTSGTEIEIPYWIESRANNSWAYVWFRVPRIPASGYATVYVYYKNSTPVSSASNGYLVFEFFEDWETCSFNTSKYNTDAILGTDFEVVSGSPFGGCGLHYKTGRSTGRYYNIWTKENYTNGIFTAYVYSSYNNDDFSLYTRVNGSFSNYNPYGFIYNVPRSGWQYTRIILGPSIIDLVAISTTFTSYNYKMVVINNGTTLRYALFQLPAGNLLAFPNTTNGNYTTGMIGFGGAGWDASRNPWVDNLYFRKYAEPEPTTILGSEETPSQPTNLPPTITILEPYNTTYWFTNIQFKVLVYDDNSATFTLKFYVDNNLVRENTNYANNTLEVFNLSFSLPKTYNFTVLAIDTNGNSSTLSRFFTIKDYEISATIYEPYPYETEKYNYSIIFRVNFGLIENITSKLYWNSTEKDYDTQVINSTHIENKIQITVPLVQQNATSINHYWWYNVTYKNETTYVSQTSPNSQTILFAYFLSSNAQTQDRTQLIEREDFTNYLTVVTLKNYANLSANSTYRNTIKTMEQISYNTFRTIFDSGEVNGFNETYQVSAVLTISFQGNTRIMNSESDNIRVFRMVLTDCSASSISQVRTLNFTLRNEENSAVLSQGTIEITNKITKTNELFREYAFTFRNISSAAVCIYPSWATYINDAMIQYRAVGYTARTYFIYATINNQTQYVDLFLLPEDQSYSVVFFVRDENNNPVTDVIIKVQRYFVGENVYKTVAQCKSDNPDGKCVTFLKILDVYYRQILEKNLTVIKETTPSQIVCQPFESITFCPPYPIPISITTKTLEGIFKRMGKINYDCTLNKETNILRCTVSDTSQLMTKAQFIVEKKGALKFEPICDQTEFSSATTFVCDLGNTTGNIYRYKILGYFSEPPVLISQDILDFSIGLITWGTTGLLLAFFITSSLFFVGIFNPVASMVFAFLGLIIGYLFGMLPVSISSLIGLGLVVGIIIWKLRS